MLLAAFLALVTLLADLAAVSAPAAARCDRTVEPGASVERLARSLRAGEVGCLRGGEYAEDVTVSRGGRPRQPITLRSAPGERATIRGVLAVADAADYVTIRSLDLRGRRGDDTPSVQINGDHVTLNNDDISNHNSAICVVLGGDFEHYGVARRTQILHNRIHDCGRLPRGGHDHGIYVEGSQGARIARNLIYRNADWGVHLYPDATRTRVVSNVIDGNGGGVIFAGEDDSGEYSRSYASSANTVAYNVISNSRRTYNVESYWGGRVGDRNTAVSNCLWNGAQGNVGKQVGFVAKRNVVANPNFSAGYRLAPGGRCGGRRYGPGR